MELAHTNSRLSVWRPASLPKGQLKNFETLAFVARRHQDAGLTYPLRSELRGTRGGSMQEASNILPRALKDHQFVIVVLASNPASYTTIDKLNSIKMAQIEGDQGDPLEYYHIVRPNAEKRVPLPSHSLAWTITSHIVWDDINPAVLTEDQQQAMLDWLHWGGQIVISGPSSLDKLKGSFLNPYLPAEAAETIKLDETAFAELNAVWSLPDLKKRPRTIKVIPDRPMVGIRFKRHTDASDVPGTGGLVIERRVGGGRILVTAFPLTDVRIKQWKNFDGFFNCALLRRPPREFGATKDGLDNLTVVWTDTRIRHMWMDPRFGSTVRYFTRDVGFLTGDPQAPPANAVRVPQVMPGGVGTPMASAGMVQYGYPMSSSASIPAAIHPCDRRLAPRRLSGHASNGHCRLERRRCRLERRSPGPDRCGRHQNPQGRLRLQGADRLFGDPRAAQLVRVLDARPRRMGVDRRPDHLGRSARAR